MSSYEAVNVYRQDEDEARQSRRHSNTRSLSRINEQQAGHTSTVTTTAVYTYYYDKSEKEVYKTKICGQRPTLKSYKDLMPKKGSQFKRSVFFCNGHHDVRLFIAAPFHFSNRFFFKTTDESGTNVFLEELFNDNDPLPLFEQKVMGVVTTNALQHPCDNGGECTIALYTYVNELPYRTKIPGRNVTLRQFIDFMPKAGNFR